VNENKNLYKKKLPLSVVEQTETHFIKGASLV
jgi:hypothetical protein